MESESSIETSSLTCSAIRSFHSSREYFIKWLRMESLDSRYSEIRARRKSFTPGHSSSAVDAKDSTASPFTIEWVNALNLLSLSSIEPSHPHSRSSNNSDGPFGPNNPGAARLIPRLSHLHLFQAPTTAKIPPSHSTLPYRFRVSLTLHHRSDHVSRQSKIQVGQLEENQFRLADALDGRTSADLRIELEEAESILKFLFFQRMKIFDWEEWEILFDTYLAVEEVQDDSRKRN